MSDEPDFYALLEVAPNADDATIRAAFRQLARRYHPDVAGTGNLERMQKLNAAYQALSDPERRLQYDLRHQARWRTQSTPRAGAIPPLSAALSSRAGIDTVQQGPFRSLQVIETSERIPIGALGLGRASQIAAIGTLDGRALVWDMATQRLLRCLSSGAASAAGVLQELRLSPTGAIIMAWGYRLGVRVWNAADGATLWNTNATAPSGLMDAALFDTPAMLRIAFPQAPMALAGDDPFRWAHEGRHGTSVLSRPLIGPIAAGWAIPLECAEDDGGHSHDQSHSHPGVQYRSLSEDGHRLLTCLSQPRKNGALSRVIHVWDLDHRSLRGVAQPRVTRTVLQPLEDLDFPMAFTPDLAWGIATRRGHEMAIFSLAEKKAHAISVGPVAPDARVALSADGSYVALAHEATLRLWHAPSGQFVQMWRAATEIGPIVFARRQNAHLLAVGLADGLVELWTA